MKFKIEITLIIIAFILIPTATLADPTPVHIQENPSFSITPINNNPIKINREHLTFRINKSSTSKATVAAKYTLTNTSGEDITVPIIFPFVSRYHKQVAPKIEFDDKIVDYKIYNAGHLNVLNYQKEPELFNEQVEINDIIKNINENYVPKHFDDTDTTTLLKVTYPSASEIKKPGYKWANINFDMDTNKTKVLTFGFSSYGIDYNSNGGKYHVGNNINSIDIDKTRYILVLGEDTLTNIESNNIRSNYNAVVEKLSVNTKDFILENIVNWYDIGNMDLNNFYSMLIKEIDKSFKDYDFNIDYWSVISDMFDNNNLLVYLFDIKLKTDSSDTLHINFPMKSSIDRKTANDNIYTFAHIRNPARNFSELKDIKIHIELNNKSPYIVESSMPVNMIDAGTYVVLSDNISNKHFVFSTYVKEEITLTDRITARILSLIDMSVAVPLILIMLVVVLWRKSKKTNKG